MTRRVGHLRIAALAIGVFVAAYFSGSTGITQGANPAVDGDDIGGVVTGASGPEAGVWVIAESTETPTRLIKTVVTDDQGRFVVPDLPKATYDVWVRGYGLVDSAKVKATPGKTVALKATPAPNPKA